MKQHQCRWWIHTEKVENDMIVIRKIDCVMCVRMCVKVGAHMMT